METKVKLANRTIFRKTPVLPPMQRVFVSAASSSTHRSKKHPVSLQKVDFTKKEK